VQGLKVISLNFSQIGSETLALSMMKHAPHSSGDRVWKDARGIAMSAKVVLVGASFHRKGRELNQNCDCMRDDDGSSFLVLRKFGVHR
jgi:hypothetical protein